MAKNFKPNQKVVFRNITRDPVLELFMNIPKENEIITIVSKCSEHKKCWDLKEYPFAIDGMLQSFSEINLFPIEEKEQTVTLAVKKVKLEPKKVLEKTEELLTAN